MDGSFRAEHDTMAKQRTLQKHAIQVPITAFVFIGVTPKAPSAITLQPH